MGLRHIVQRGGGFVHEDDAWTAHHRPGDQQPLALSAGDTRAVFAQHGVKLHGHTAHILGQACLFKGFPCLVFGHVGLYDREIGENGALHQLAVLQHRADSAAQTAQVQGFHVVVVIIDCALLRLFKAEHQPHQGGLAASRRSHDGEVFAGGNVQRHIIQQHGAVLVVAEAEMAYADLAGQLFRDQLARFDLRLRFQNGLHHVQHRAELRQGGHDADQRRECAGNQTIG